MTNLVIPLRENDGSSKSAFVFVRTITDPAKVRRLLQGMVENKFSFPSGVESVHMPSDGSFWLMATMSVADQLEAVRTFVRELLGVELDEHEPMNKALFYGLTMFNPHPVRRVQQFLGLA